MPKSIKINKSPIFLSYSISKELEHRVLRANLPLKDQ